MLDLDPDIDVDIRHTHKGSSTQLPATEFMLLVLGAR